MYLPAHFREDRLETQHALMRAHPFATFVTEGADGPVADPVPTTLHDEGELGVIRAHVARANPLWHTHPASRPVLVIFAGAEHYITPSWYATKRETGRVVPTWNYAAVHAYGHLVVHEEPEWLMAQIEGLTRRFEETRPEPWAVTDAPEAFVQAQVRGIVGVEIAITRIEAKWKVSQNRSEADRAGVVAGLVEAGAPSDLAMAALVLRRSSERG